MQETYKGKVKVSFRHFPLNFHKDAHKAAQASECANDQGKFWAYHDKLFENQRTLGVDNLKQYARDLGLDGTTFDECLDSNKYAKLVDTDMSEGQSAGVTGTPAFFVNGRLIKGAAGFDRFQSVIDDELTRKGK